MPRLSFQPRLASLSGEGSRTARRPDPDAVGPRTTQQTDPPWRCWAQPPRSAYNVEASRFRMNRPRSPAGRRGQRKRDGIRGGAGDPWLALRSSTRTDLPPASRFGIRRQSTGSSGKVVHRYTPAGARHNHHLVSAISPRPPTARVRIETSAQSLMSSRAAVQWSSSTGPTSGHPASSCMPAEHGKQYGGLMARRAITSRESSRLVGVRPTMGGRTTILTQTA
jgi:hypothetical protein